jgi:serine/threonine protein kinase
MGCFTQLQAAETPCLLCGYDAASTPTQLYQLPLRTILSGKYMVGRVLGEGGFGITYVGYDLNLDLKVAIKEFYPSGFVTRSSTLSTTVQPHHGEQGDIFIKGRDRFVDEAKRLAKFRVFAGIVMVSDFFVENGTAYIVMEYVDGVTLKSYIAQMGGRLPPEQVLEMLKPIFSSLAQVHESGIIHRDISPDNIMITADGNVKLLDFGAAREFDDEANKSLSVLLKHGYAPAEQYRTKGAQGPYTDVYALSATIYKAITGVTPESSMDRMFEDKVEPPGALGVILPDYQGAALMKGLAIRREDRYQTIKELYTALGLDAATQTPQIALPIIKQPASQTQPLVTSPPQPPVISPTPLPPEPVTEFQYPQQPVGDVVPDIPSANPISLEPTPVPMPSPDEQALDIQTHSRKPIQMTKRGKTIAAIVAACIIVAIVFVLTTLLPNSDNIPAPPDDSITLSGEDAADTTGDNEGTQASEPEQMPTPERVEIDLWQREITDAQLVEMITSGEIPANVTVLQLGDNQISDLSPFIDLMYLSILSIDINRVSDLSPLREMPNLTQITLGYNQISDLSPLSEMTNLTRLDLHFNQITDISPLSELTKLTFLTLQENQVTDISPLSRLTNLTDLILDGNQITDWSPVTHLKNVSGMESQTMGIFEPPDIIFSVDDFILFETPIEDVINQYSRYDYTRFYANAILFELPSLPDRDITTRYTFSTYHDQNVLDYVEMLLARRTVDGGIRNVVSNLDGSIVDVGDSNAITFLLLGKYYFGEEAPKLFYDFTGLPNHTDLQEGHHRLFADENKILEIDNTMDSYMLRYTQGDKELLIVVFNQIIIDFIMYGTNRLQ